MENTGYIALSRQMALWNQMDNVANNMANVNTTGFKSELTLFSEDIAKSKTADRPLKDKLSYVHDFGMAINMESGPIQSTGNTLDVALKGDGFFVVETDQGEKFTRKGSFMLDADGQLVTNEGNPVLSDAGTPFFFAPNETQINISGDGTVSTENGQIGKMRIVRFDKPDALKREAAGLFSAEEQPKEVARPEMVQGALEGSNVEPILEMTKMIALQRSYQGVQQMIDTEHERQKKAIDTFTKPA